MKVLDNLFESFKATLAFFLFLLFFVFFVLFFCFFCFLLSFKLLDHSYRIQLSVTIGKMKLNVLFPWQLFVLSSPNFVCIFGPLQVTLKELAFSDSIQK